MRSRARATASPGPEISARSKVAAADSFKGNARLGADNSLLGVCFAIGWFACGPGPGFYFSTHASRPRSES